MQQGVYDSAEEHSKYKPLPIVLLEWWNITLLNVTIFQSRIEMLSEDLTTCIKLWFITQVLGPHGSYGKLVGCSRGGMVAITRRCL